MFFCRYFFLTLFSNTNNGYDKNNPGNAYDVDENSDGDINSHEINVIGIVKKYWVKRRLLQ